jgi:hypothetical protein
VQEAKGCKDVIVCFFDALKQNNKVSCETFTCIYGFPAVGMGHEEVADLKLLADAVIANGVNRIVWHGMPFFGSRFYATVHVGREGSLSAYLLPFNRYLASVCEVMQRGEPYTQLAVYLGVEDARMKDTIPREKRTPGSCFEWEMRDVIPKNLTLPYAPLYVSNKAFLHDNSVMARFKALYVECEWMEPCALDRVCDLASRTGLLVIWGQFLPKLPGHNRSDDVMHAYAQTLARIATLPNVFFDNAEFSRLTPVMQSVDDNVALPMFWVRQLEGDELLVFVANPAASGIRYPMRMGQSIEASQITRRSVFLRGNKVATELVFNPFESLLIRVSRSGDVSQIDHVPFTPPTPSNEELE